MKAWANDPDHAYLTGEELNHIDMSPYMGTMCTPGYTGPLCGSCEPNYGRVGFQCSRCFTHTWGHYLLYVVVWVYLFGMVVVAGWIHVREVMQRHQKKQAGATMAVLQPHLLGSLSRQPSEVHRQRELPHQGSSMGRPGPPAYAADTQDAGMVMVASNNASFYKPNSSTRDTDSAFMCQSAAAGAAAAAAAGTGSSGGSGLPRHAPGTHPAHLSDSSLVGVLSSATDDTRPQRDAGGVEEDKTAAAGDEKGGSKGPSGQSRAPTKRRGRALRKLLSTEDLDEEDCQQLASAASEGKLGDPTAAPSSVVVDRSEMFYISDVVKVRGGGGGRC
jgi:hypothetical protein